MRLVRASIRNLMGIEQADIDFGHVNVFVGPNGSGKSTILEAVLLPIFGETPRVAKKKDWGAMIRDGQRGAEVYVQVGVRQPDGTEIVRELCAKISQKSASVEPIKLPDLNDTVLMDPLAFFSLPAKVKADLVGTVKLEPSAVVQALKDWKLEGMVQTQAYEIIMRYGLSGAEKELVERRLLATRAILDPGPEPKMLWNGQEVVPLAKGDLAAGMTHASKLGGEANAAWTQLVKLRQTNAERARYAAILAEAELVLKQVSAPAEFPRKAELDTAQVRYNQMGQEFRVLSITLEGLRRVLIPCPTCNRPWKPSPEFDDLNLKVETIAETRRIELPAIDALKSEWGNWLAQGHEQRLAITKKEEATKALSSLPAQVDEEMAAAAYAKLDTDSKTYAEWIRSAGIYWAAKDSWDRATSNAAIAKSDRAAWDLAVDIIRDPTFKSSLTKDPLDRVRSRILQTQGTLEMKVELGDDLDVKVNGRPWWLLSTSQRMRASMILADAFAYAGGSRILKIDGVDINVGKMQGRIMDFIQTVKSGYDTVLLALASDDAPPAFAYLEKAASTPGYSPMARWYWVGNGTVSFRREL